MKIKETLALALVTAGMLAGGAAITATPHVQYLADYGSNQTAENAVEYTRDAGVRHDPAGHHHRNA